MNFLIDVIRRRESLAQSSNGTACHGTLGHHHRAVEFMGRGQSEATDVVIAVVFSPDGAQIGSLLKRDLESTPFMFGMRVMENGLSHHYIGHEGIILSLLFSPDGLLLIMNMFRRAVLTTLAHVSN